MGLSTYKGVSLPLAHQQDIRADDPMAPLHI